MSRTAHRLYISSLSASTARPASPSLFQFVRKLRSPQGNSRTTVTQLSVAGTLYSDPVDVADALNEQFIGFGTQDDPSWNVPDFNPPDAPSRGRTTPTLQDVTTTPFVVAKQIRNLKTRKAAGTDGISHELLKLFCSSTAYPLSLIFNLTFATGAFPAIWKHAIVTPVFKGALRLHFRRRVFDAKTKVGEREDTSNKNESPEAIESSRKTTFEFWPSER